MRVRVKLKAYWIEVSFQVLLELDLMWVFHGERGRVYLV